MWQAFIVCAARQFEPVKYAKGIVKAALVGLIGTLYPRG